MKVISFMNHKGGVGKTTLVVNLARGIYLDDDPRSIMLVDADPQGSLRDWQNASDEKMSGLDVIGADRRQSLLGAEAIAQNNMAGYMLIDTPGDINEIHGAAISISDLIVIPVRPSPWDVWATMDMINLVRNAMPANPKLKAMFVLNQAIPNCTINKEVIEALKEFEEIKLINSAIAHRVSFAKVVNSGQTVYESKDNLAIKECDNVITELLAYLYSKED